MNIDGKDENEFIPGFQFIKHKNLNDLIDFFKIRKVEAKTANIILKMVVYEEVVYNRVIEIIFFEYSKLFI